MVVQKVDKKRKEEPSKDNRPQWGDLVHAQVLPEFMQETSFKHDQKSRNKAWIDKTKGRLSTQYVVITLTN